MTECAESLALSSATPGEPDLALIPVSREGLELEIARGRREPFILGWAVSKNKEELVEPAPTVIYRGATGEEAVISGGRAVNGWRPDADGRWKASTELDNFRQLHVDGKRAVRARRGALPGAELHGEDGYTTTAVEMADWTNPGDIEFCY